MRKEVERASDRLKKHMQKMQHQVKNDFNLLSGIMLLQSEALKDNSELYEVLQQNMNRIKAVGLLYEQAYQHTTPDHIVLPEYIRAVAQSLKSTYVVPDKDIRLDIHVECVILPVEKARACGLIICEALTNSFKHAFTELRQGSITLSIILSGTQVVIEIRDNGKGLPATFSIEQVRSSGMLLIRSFASQINASLEIIGTNGTALRVVLKV